MTDAAALTHPPALKLLVGQARHQTRLFWRTPVAAFFTLGLPLILLFVFNALFGNEPIPGMGVTMSQFYAPSLAVFGAATACYTYLAVSTAIQRDSGVLKRMRGTPLPPSLYIAGRIVSSIWLALLGVAVMLACGAIFYGLQIEWRAVPAAAVTLLVGMASFAALGMMVAALVRSGDTAQAVANATLLTLAFVSNVFIPPNAVNAPWLATVADLFPLKHFSTAFSQAFDPRFGGHGFVWSAEPGQYAILKSLAVLAAWGVVGGLIAVKRFRWEPGLNA